MNTLGGLWNREVGCGAAHSKMTGDFDLRLPVGFTSSHLFVACWRGMERVGGTKAQSILTTFDHVKKKWE